MTHNFEPAAFLFKKMLSVLFLLNILYYRLFAYMLLASSLWILWDGYLWKQVCPCNYMCFLCIFCQTFLPLCLSCPILFVILLFVFVVFPIIFCYYLLNICLFFYQKKEWGLDPDRSDGEELGV